MCKKTISKFNELDDSTDDDSNHEDSTDGNLENLEYGFSPLHLHIRLLDVVLHISYKLDFEEWQVNKNMKTSDNHSTY